MKKIFSSVLLIVSFFSVRAQTINSPVDYVNTLMGTDSKPSLSNGNEYPAICLPWGMNLWTPQTGNMGSGWQYTYNSDKIKGFKQTHQPSPWMNDYGQFSIMPVTRKPVFKEDERASWFSHKAEMATPYYYSVYLADQNVTTEITPTERAAIFRFTFPKTDSSFVVADAFNKGSYIKIIPSKNKIIGYSVRYSSGHYNNFKNYFVMVFDHPFTTNYAWHDSVAEMNMLELQKDHVGALVGFSVKKEGEQVNVKVASSFISAEQAEQNLKELGSDDFETVKKRAKAKWNEVLSKVAVESNDKDKLKTFYSCLYRAVIFPTKLYEIDANGKPVHWSPYNGKTLPGYMFGGTGFWDTFRALYPFLNMVYPSINKEMQEGLVNDYKEGGFLPEWSSPGYANVMVGNNSASVVSDAYIKGLRGYDINTLYEALVHGANNEGPEGTGRTGVAYYNKLGYVPYNVKINENAARTLEYAYDDFTIYQLGKALKRPQTELDIYAKRCLNYRNLFDSSHNLMRGKNEDGTFQSPFNPFKWGDAFTEGNSWHYSWSVFHDIQGLINLMGGKRTFVGMLDSVFIMPPVFDDSYYGGVIHEIREMQIMNMGQYAHGNQPIQHMTYLYNYAGEPWKTQYHVRDAMNKLYKATPDGYCGDEDNGQTSAWYVFSALGFYPVCPATDQYVLGTPFFSKATLTLDNGKNFVITANSNSDTNFYVQSAALNSKPYTHNYITQSDIQAGGSFTLQMGNQPNKGKGTEAKDYPYSFSISK